MHCGARAFLLVIVAGARADGSAERTRFDGVLASLCPAHAAPYKLTGPPTLVQSSAANVTVNASGSPLAVYVTDADGTIVALSKNRSYVTLTVPNEAVHQPQRLTPHAVYAALATGADGRTSAACSTADGTGVDNWKSFVENFDYMGAGGAHPGAPGGPNETVLSASVPRLAVSADGRRATVSLQRDAAFFIPLLYVTCQTTHVIGLYPLERASWPASGASAFVTSLDVWSLGLADGSCLRLHACAAMPAQESCGGFPQRCADIDLLPYLVAAIEKAAVTTTIQEAAATTAAAGGGGDGNGKGGGKGGGGSSGGKGGGSKRVGDRPTTTASAAELQVSASLSHGMRLRVRAEPCDGMRFYLKSGGRASTLVPPRVLAFGAGDLHLSLSEHNLSAASTLHVYRACGPLQAPHLSHTSLPLAPIIRDFEELNKRTSTHSAAAAAAAGTAASAATASPSGSRQWSAQRQPPAIQPLPAATPRPGAQAKLAAKQQPAVITAQRAVRSPPLELPPALRLPAVEASPRGGQRLNKVLSAVLLGCAIGSVLIVLIVAGLMLHRRRKRHLHRPHGTEAGGTGGGGCCSVAVPAYKLAPKVEDSKPVPV